MGLIVTVVLGVLAVIGACASRLLADELKAWVPSVVERIISFAITRAPRHLRERLTEEWRSHVNDTPGHLGKLYIALGFIWASGKLRNEVEQAGIQESPLREPDAERPWAELLRAVDELRKDVPQYVGTDESAWPPYCSAARDGRHNVPQAAPQGMAAKHFTVRACYVADGSTPAKCRTGAAVGPSGTTAMNRRTFAYAKMPAHGRQKYEVDSRCAKHCYDIAPRYQCRSHPLTVR